MGWKYFEELREFDQQRHRRGQFHKEGVFTKGTESEKHHAYGENNKVLDIATICWASSLYHQLYIYLFIQIQDIS